jgi:hypothetical protein
LLLFAFNFQQTLASGVIGAGAAIMVAAAVGVFRTPQPKENQPPPKKLNPAIAAALIVLGLALVVVGVIWRVNSREG